MLHYTVTVFEWLSPTNLSKTSALQEEIISRVDPAGIDTIDRTNKC